MKWIRFRETWAHGHTEWHWKYFSNSVSYDDIQEEFDEMAQEYYWTDKFRSIEWEEAEVPEDVLDERIRLAESGIEIAKRKLALLLTFKNNRNSRK